MMNSVDVMNGLPKELAKDLSFRIETSFREWVDYFISNQKQQNGLTNEFSNKLCYGKLTSVTIQSGLSYFISNLSFKQTVRFDMFNADSDSHYIYMLKVLNGDDVVLYDKENNDNISQTHKGIVILAPGKIPHGFRIGKGAQIKLLILECSKKWKESYLMNDSRQEFYFNQSKEVSDDDVQKHIFSAEINRLFKVIYYRFTNLSMYSGLNLHSYIYLIADAVLTLFLNKADSLSYPKVSDSELEKLKQILILLSTDFEKGFPSIRNLSRLALMSESKLKNCFKNVYGMTIYQYYQRERMQYARELLASGKYMVSEVAYRIGYSSLSNFTLAFQKEFGLFPKKVKKTN